MCRIAGFRDFNYKGDYSLNETLAVMRDALQYGGPDDCGNYVSEDHALALGHRRLSIIELSALGHQPMSNDDGSIWVTYNGEIYNFQEIKRELEASGVTFRGNSDTEVLLKAYEKWGMSALHKFRGMWAFAVWNERTENLILCRDRIGVKPLYWYWSDGLFLFASEIKSFHSHPKFRKKLKILSLLSYLQLGYIVAPETIFENTYKLKPGHYLTIDRNRNIHEVKYWDIDDSYSQSGSRFKNRNEADITAELEYIMAESFSLRLVSDVPVGMFLSGGIDSSLVTALLCSIDTSPIKTFTIGFHEAAFNEARYAKRISDYLGTDHTELYCTQDDALRILPLLPHIYDEPFADSSAIPTLLVSHLARQKVKVCLSADGGDEFFCGYPKYNFLGNQLKSFRQNPLFGLCRILFSILTPDAAQHIYDLIRPFYRIDSFKDKYKKMRAIIGSENILSQSMDMSSIFLPEDIRKLGFQDGNAYPESRNHSYDDVTSMMLFDSRTYLPDDILVKVDRAGMAVALENREPLLDHVLLEYAASLPVMYKLSNGKGKYILKRILGRHLPRTLTERPKQGFGAPMTFWLKGRLSEFTGEYLNEHRIKSSGLFNWKAVNELIMDFSNDRGVHDHRIWSLLMFEMWREYWLEGSSPPNLSACASPPGQLH